MCMIQFYTYNNPPNTGALVFPDVHDTIICVVIEHIIYPIQPPWVYIYGLVIIVSCTSGNTSAPVLGWLL
jgi:hypothetical protein